MIDGLDEQINACERELRALGADHAYGPLLRVPGVGWVLAYTIASEIGDIGRFATPAKLVAKRPTPSVEQSGERDRRGPLRKNGPNQLRWALVEGAHTASRHPLYQPTLERNRARHGRKRAPDRGTTTRTRRDLAQLHSTVCSGRRHASSGRVDGPLRIALPEQSPHQLITEKGAMKRAQLNVTAEPARHRP